MIILHEPVSFTTSLDRFTGWLLIFSVIFDCSFRFILLLLIQQLGLLLFLIFFVVGVSFTRVDRSAIDVFERLQGADELTPISAS